MLLSRVARLLRRLSSSLFAFTSLLMGRGGGAGGVGGEGIGEPSLTGHQEDGAGWSPELVDPLSSLLSPGGNLRSRESRHSINIFFFNACTEPVRLYWLDYGGAEVKYKTIDVGRTHRQQTFISHPWAACTVGEPRRRMALNGQPAIFPAEMQVEAGAPDGAPDEDDDEEEIQRTMEVTVAPPLVLQWSPSNHTRFPKAFRTAAETLILCHARLYDEPGTLGVLPFALRDVIIGLAAPTVPFWRPIQEPPPDTPPAE